MLSHDLLESLVDALQKKSENLLSVGPDLQGNPFIPGGFTPQSEDTHMILEDIAPEPGDLQLEHILAALVQFT